MNPRLDINYPKLVHNTKTLVNMAKKHGVSIAGVTKVFMGEPAIAQAYVDGGVDYLADSRVQNLEKLKNFPIPKMLLRIPMPSEVDKVVSLADISLNSELITIKKLNEAAKKKNLIHDIILMRDLGDLREGIFEEEEFKETLNALKELQNIHVKGIGVNLTCYGGIIPTKDHLSTLESDGAEMEKVLGYPIDIFSGGNSSSVYLMEKNDLPKKINQLRLGEAIVLGTESAYGETIPNTYQDAFQLVAEVIEIKEKPSMPIGEIGMDAFGNKPTFEDKGIRKRCILGVGKQDFGSYELFPVSKDHQILGSSSDHLIIDVTDDENVLVPGDEIRFNLRYGALLSLLTSPFVTKNVVYND